MSRWDPRTAITRKRTGSRVSGEDIERLVLGYARGEVADGPMAAFLMACVLRGMDASETDAMTRAFVASGSTVALGDVGRPVVDKHSTGGVSHAVSLVFAPLVAALGLVCVKVSGRGLGHTGGTIDKLEAIPGFRVDLDVGAMRRQAERVGCVIASQTPELVPADGAVYALRDATGTVESVPLIAASVMAKKLAVDADVILLDVKAGSGAFMPDADAAARLAAACLAIARAAGRRAGAAITDMSQPLGTAIGNALEVAEAIEVLSNRRDGRLRELAVWLAARALRSATALGSDEATTRATAALADGSALASFAAWVDAQGGSARVIDDPAAILPRAAVQRPILGGTSGFVSGIDAAAVGLAAQGLGAGRSHKGDTIDPAVGIVLTRKIGEPVERGEPIGTVHARDAAAAEAAAIAVNAALQVGEERVEPPPLVYGWSEEG
jgi:pyrimidine-nucleoside phosphorylase